MVLTLAIKSRLHQCVSYVSTAIEILSKLNRSFFMEDVINLVVPRDPGIAIVPNLVICSDQVQHD